MTRSLFCAVLQRIESPLDCSFAAALQEKVRSDMLPRDAVEDVWERRVQGSIALERSQRVRRAPGWLKPQEYINPMQPYSLVGGPPGRRYSDEDAEEDGQHHSDPSEWEGLLLRACGYVEDGLEVLVQVGQVVGLTGPLPVAGGPYWRPCAYLEGALLTQFQRVAGQRRLGKQEHLVSVQSIRSQLAS